LEPCAHFGKTPPCADLIIQYKIPRVVIGCRDPFPEVDGKGIEKLKASGVQVEVGILESECKELNKRFFTFHEKKRPYVILKWAETADNKIASGNEERLMISNEYSNKLVHQWRSEEAAILVGTNTAMLDDPELTTRLWQGISPVRLVLDMNLRLPVSLKVFNKEVKTIVFNSIKNEEEENLVYYKIRKDENIFQQMMNVLYELKIQSVIVEGGAKFLQSFIDEGIWDEARIIKNEKLKIINGLNSPVLKNELKIAEEKILSDKIEVYHKLNTD
jgi:diaminohydroxyphosphoribosylaminopyrimidine deaminase/5-amino-6-(5-phosphoribosylamino)uracil reductase